MGLGETCFGGTSSVLWNPWHLFKFGGYPELPSFNPPSANKFQLDPELRWEFTLIYWKHILFGNNFKLNKNKNNAKNSPIPSPSSLVIILHHLLLSFAFTHTLPLSHFYSCRTCVCAHTYLYICKCYLLWMIWGWVINIMAPDFCTI